MVVGIERGGGWKGLYRGGGDVDVVINLVPP